MEQSYKWPDPQPAEYSATHPYHYSAPPSQPPHHSYHHHHHHHHQNPNPNPNPSPLQAHEAAVAVPPPAAAAAEDPYAHLGVYAYPLPRVDPTPPPYYHHHHHHHAAEGGGEPHGIHHYGVDPRAAAYADVYPLYARPGYADPRAVAYADSYPPPAGYAPFPPRPLYGPGAPFHAPPFLPHPRPHARPGVKRVLRKTTKVVQSAYCEVCKVDCTSQEDLNSHKQGRRHKKNVQKLQDSITPKLPKAPALDAAKEPAPEVATKGKAVAAMTATAGEKQKKRKEVGPAKEEEDLETKKRKILEGGATPDGVRVCTICNVVVNSPKVYELHVGGQKHIAMVKQQKEQAAAAAAS